MPDDFPQRPVTSSSTGAMLFVGYRVRSVSPAGPEGVGIIREIHSPGFDQRARVQWADSTEGWYLPSRLMRVGSPSENERHPETRAALPRRIEPRQLIDEPVIEPAALTLDQQAEAMVDSVTDAICDLVRVACLRDETLYRTFLERVAQRLGDV